MAKQKQSYAVRNRKSVEKYGLTLYQRRIQSGEEKGLVRSQARGHPGLGKLSVSEERTAKKSMGTGNDNFLKGIYTLSKKNKSPSETQTIIDIWRKAEKERKEDNRKQISINSFYGAQLNDLFNNLNQGGRMYEFYY